MVDVEALAGFLAQRRIALIGASNEDGNLAKTVYRTLRRHGYNVVPVNPHIDDVDGARCHPRIADVPGRVDGAIIMVGRPRAEDAVRACIDHGVHRIWLFRGLGPGAVTSGAVAACRDAGVSVVEGACPLMFLPPVRGVHRFHRGLRRLRGGLRSAPMRETAPHG